VRKLIGALVTAGLLTATACAPDTGDDADAGSQEPGSPYRIVQLVGQNQAGPAALNARAAAQAATAAVAVLNEKGGILGHPVELEIIDDGGDPTTAVTKLQERLRTGPRPNLVLPGNTSAEALPMAPVITEAEILSVQQASADVGAGARRARAEGRGRPDRDDRRQGRLRPGDRGRHPGGDRRRWADAHG
jgi:branched-chain amino acid transport system substrate-binding protein